MTTPTYAPKDVVRFALGKDAVNAAAAFDQLVGARVYDAVQARKIEIAKTMFGSKAVEDALQPDEEVEASSEEQQDQEEEQQQEVEAAAEEEAAETSEESEESNENAEQSA